MPIVNVRTLRHDITIRTGGEAGFMYLEGAPEVSAALAPASIAIQQEGAFRSATWLGLAPTQLTRVASTRDLACQLDVEIAELSLRDAVPGTLLSSSLMSLRGKRLLLLGPTLPRTALALALFRHGVDIEGDWFCRLSPSGLTALPRSLRWGVSLGRAYPDILEVIAEINPHHADTRPTDMWAWCPKTEDRRWSCSSGSIDGIVVTDDMAGGCSLARSLAPEMAWGFLMAARLSGDGGLTKILALKSLAAAVPAIKLSVGDLAGAINLIMQFWSILDT